MQNPRAFSASAAATPRGSAYVSYGLGNFQFYSAGGLSSQTGVLTLTADGRHVSHPQWTPGVISAGLPIPLHGAAAAGAVAGWQSLRDCTGLTAEASSHG